MLPNGLDWQPQSGAFWTAVNERDEIGNDLVPDYITSVKDGAFFGFTNVAAGSRGIAKVLFFIALTIFLIVLVFGVMLGVLVF